MSTSPIPQDRPILPAAGFLLLLALGLFWGLNWPAMKLSVQGLPVWWFRAISVGAGAVGVLIWAKLAIGTLRVRRWEIRAMALCAVFVVIGWQVLTGYGVSLMPAGRAAIIAYMMPVFASLLAVPILGEPLTPTKVTGLILGTSGLAVLMGPDIAVLAEAPLGASFMLAAAFSWGLGTVLFKKFKWESPVVVLVGWQLFIGALVIVPIAIFFERQPVWSEVPQDTWLALAYLIALPMIFCQWAYLKVVSIFPAAIAAIGTLLVPIVGVVSSAIILREPIGWQEILAMALISAALIVVMVVPALIRR